MSSTQSLIHLSEIKKVFYTDHDPRYAQHADRVVHIFAGSIVDEEIPSNNNGASTNGKTVVAASGPQRLNL